jgi:hypothetical protein
MEILLLPHPFYILAFIDSSGFGICYPEDIGVIP